jgi:hypothetical protein
MLYVARSMTAHTTILVVHTLLAPDEQDMLDEHLGHTEVIHQSVHGDDVLGGSGVALGAVQLLYYQVRGAAPAHITERGGGTGRESEKVMCASTHTHIHTQQQQQQQQQHGTHASNCICARSSGYRNPGAKCCPSETRACRKELMGGGSEAGRRRVRPPTIAVMRTCTGHKTTGHYRTGHNSTGHDSTGYNRTELVSEPCQRKNSLIVTPLHSLLPPSSLTFSCSRHLAGFARTS